MEELTLEEMTMIRGGWANPEGCKQVQEDAADLDADSPDSDWDDWYNRFYRECMGMEPPM